MIGTSSGRPCSASAAGAAAGSQASCECESGERGAGILAFVDEGEADAAGVVEQALPRLCDEVERLLWRSSAIE